MLIDFGYRRKELWCIKAVQRRGLILWVALTEGLSEKVTESAAICLRNYSRYDFKCICSDGTLRALKSTSDLNQHVFAWLRFITKKKHLFWENRRERIEQSDERCGNNKKKWKMNGRHTVRDQDTETMDFFFVPHIRRITIRQQLSNSFSRSFGLWDV